jgi:hypothetical protein
VEVDTRDIIQILLNLDVIGRIVVVKLLAVVVAGDHVLILGDKVVIIVEVTVEATSLIVAKRILIVVSLLLRLKVLILLEIRIDPSLEVLRRNVIPIKVLDLVHV